MHAEHWVVSCYLSGTMVVADEHAPHEGFKYGVRSLAPWLYIFGPGGATEDDYYRNRSKVCEDVANFLNGGHRPKWLDDMDRVTETRASSLDGTSINAVGPMIDSNPPACLWVQDESEDAKTARARLMDRIFSSK